MPAKPLTANEQSIIPLRKVDPHPDGKPWVKCCSSGNDLVQCQCFCKKPRLRSKSRFQLFLTEDFISLSIAISIKKAFKNKERFFCVHRKTEDGYHRECAGWAALKRKQK